MSVMGALRPLLEVVMPVSKLKGCSVSLSPARR